ncbi:hypothetical protein CDIK_0314 [Cucumispora dikerogammari]|nr:hypothetical protein CDIK_0314 [Cucumispora dikerogammari]
MLYSISNFPFITCTTKDFSITKEPTFKTTLCKTNSNDAGSVLLQFEFELNKNLLQDTSRSHILIKQFELNQEASNFDFQTDHLHCIKVLKNTISPYNVQGEFKMKVLSTMFSVEEHKSTTRYKAYLKSTNSAVITTKDELKKEITKFRKVLGIDGDKIKRTVFKFSIIFSMGEPESLDYDFENTEELNVETGFFRFEVEDDTLTVRTLKLE